MRCGNCQGRHASVEDVRACYGIRTQERHSAPAPRAAVPDVPDVPAGRYAVQLPDDRVHFFKVDRPTEGKWKGWTFVKEQAGDDLYRLSKDRRELVLETIAKDVQGASLRYGRTIGACGVCGRTLTDEHSRELGIGPICAGRMGW